MQYPRIITPILAMAMLVAQAAPAQAEEGFFSNLVQQATDLVSPSNSGESTPRPADAQTIVIKDEAVAVEGSALATQAVVDGDGTVILKSADGRSVAPAADTEKKADLAPEKKAEAPAVKEPSMFDDVLSAVGLDDDAPAATK